MIKHNPRVLIVDDDENIRVILSNLVKKEGFEVGVAEEGETALRMIRSGAVDLLITDIRVSGMDGMELLDKAKGLDRELPVVFITGHADVQGAVKAIKAGAHDYITKQYCPKSRQSKCNNQFRRKQAYIIERILNNALGNNLHSVLARRQK